MARWTSLANTTSGFVFARSTPSFGARWEWIVGTVAAEYGCDTSDLDTIEDDNGREFITLCGEPIVEILDGRVSSAEPVVLPMAAE